MRRPDRVSSTGCCAEEDGVGSDEEPSKSGEGEEKTDMTVALLGYLRIICKVFVAVAPGRNSRSMGRCGLDR